MRGFSVTFGTGIEWTEVTWNPTTGCDRVSADPILGHDRVVAVCEAVEKSVAFESPDLDAGLRVAANVPWSNGAQVRPSQLSGQAGSRSGHHSHPRR
jgi:hypothetical protein